MGRNINFESNLGELEELRNKSRGFAATGADNFPRFENKNKYEPRQVSHNVNRLFNQTNINFSSEGESSSDVSESVDEGDHKGSKNFSRNEKSILIILIY